MSPRKIRGASAGDGEELQLSPSETLAHNSAMRVSGASSGRQSTQRALASIVLGFELIIVFLMGMTVFGLSLLEPRELGIYIGIGLCVVIIVALACMRGGLGIKIGWGVHALMLAVAVIMPMSLIVSIVFLALWIFCMVRGAQIDRGREAWLASQDAQN